MVLLNIQVFLSKIYIQYHYFCPCNENMVSEVAKLLHHCTCLPPLPPLSLPPLPLPTSSSVSPSSTVIHHHWWGLTPNNFSLKVVCIANNSQNYNIQLTKVGFLCEKANKQTSYKWFSSLVMIVEERLSCCWVNQAISTCLQVAHSYTYE